MNRFLVFLKSLWEKSAKFLFVITNLTGLISFFVSLPITITLLTNDPQIYVFVSANPVEYADVLRWALWVIGLIWFSCLLIYIANNTMSSMYETWQESENFV